MNYRTNRRFIVGISVVLAGGVFLLDIFTPLGVAVCILYAVCVTLVLDSRDRSSSVHVAGACSCLTVVAPVLSDTIPELPLWVPMTNRAMSIMAIWAPVVWFHRYQREQEAIQRADQVSERNAVLLKEIDDRERLVQEKDLDARIMRELAQSTSSEEASRKILEIICRVLGWEWSAVWRVDERDKVLRNMMVWHLPEVDVGEFETVSLTTTLPCGMGLPGRVWASGQAAHIDNVVVDQNFPRAACAARAGLHSAFAFPIQFRGTVISIMEFFSREIRKSDQATMEALTRLSTQMGLLIDNIRAKEAITHLWTRLTLTLENAEVGLWDWNMVTNDVALDLNWNAILGYGPDERLPNRLETWQTTLHSDDASVVYRRLEEHLRDVKILYDVEYRARHKSGEWIWINSRGRVVERDAADKPLRMIGTIQDISERKRNEEALRQMEEKIRRAQKMETIGRLSGGVAHDFNNLLSVIRGYSEMVMEDLPFDSPLQQDIDAIMEAAKRGAMLTRQLLAFSRRQTLAPELINLNMLLSNFESMLRPLIGENRTLLMVQQPTLGNIKADPGQIEQIVMNLIANACDAMPAGGTVSIETADVECGETYPNKPIEMPSGSYVRLAVSDTGQGMDEVTQARIFEPFFTTKQKGTGLGLSTVYGIVKQSNGFIQVSSKLGEGSCFSVYLPRVDDEVPANPENTFIISHDAEAKTVLLVDDIEEMRFLLQRLLRRNGYHVLEACDGDQAVQVGKDYQGVIHVLLTDVMMPGLNGCQVAEQLSRIHPETKVLYMSGYTGANTLSSHMLEAGVALLQKPFTQKSLNEKIQEVLSQPY